MDHITRINLNTNTKNRKSLIDFCLNGSSQYIAIGWHHIFEKGLEINSYEDYYNAVKSESKRVNHALNVFWSAKENDLFWTRDTDGVYWICRAKGKASSRYIPDMDIGAVIPVEAYKYGLEVPGQIKASFNRPRGGTCHEINDSVIVEFSKKIYNQLSGTSTYEVKPLKGNILDNLPDFELEELVISYIQLKEGYYLLSNSIAKKSTTIKIECEFIHRNKSELKKAVVQVKGGKNEQINALEYKGYDDSGYVVYFFAPAVINNDKLKNCIVISCKDLLDFYHEYKPILPDSITKFEEII